MALNVTGVARAAAAIVAAMAAPAIAEARRRAKDGARDGGREDRGRDGDGGRDRRNGDDGDDDGGDHHGRGIWRRVEAGDGGTARASADGGTITLGSPAYEDAGGTAVAQADDAAADTTGDAEAADAGDGVIEAAARNDGYNYGGRIGNLVDDWRRVQEKRFGGVGDNKGDGPADTGTNIQVDPATGAIDYDNGNVAFIRDADGSFFVQTGNITFEAGSMGGQGDGGGNNDTDFES